MPFQFTQVHAREYLEDGLTVLRQIIPPPLLTDLRAEAEKARQIARAAQGPQAQRLQPVWSFAELDHRPFRDFLELPGLRAAVDAMLTPEHKADVMGILLEPERHAWSTNWHRDAFPLPEGVDADEYWDVGRKMKRANQLNAALYDDSSLWVVPASHNRHDTSQESAAVGPYPIAGPSLSNEMTEEEREVVCSAYVHRMPGAANVRLLAGDVAFYRPTGWHLGRYVPYVRRATLHDAFRSPEDNAWMERMRAVKRAGAAS